jgi:hypothetical protein
MSKQGIYFLPVVSEPQRFHHQARRHRWDRVFAPCEPSLLSLLNQGGPQVQTLLEQNIVLQLSIHAR